MVALVLALAPQTSADEVSQALRVGRAGHAFDHLGAIDEQAQAATDSGFTILYATGLGGVGYAGLPPEVELESATRSISKYTGSAKAAGIELAIGYVCATSMVNLATFDKNWSDEFRRQFNSLPAEWQQMDRQGTPLASWYGGDYRPACMNHPDWRAYERSMVRRQLEAGHDGMFFDNPTVHPQGCYCSHCMRGFANFLEQNADTRSAVSQIARDDVEAIRKLADAHPKQFLRYRATIARDFLAHMRSFARTVKPQALVTCNNSLNSPDQMYSQCRVYGYNISELSKVEDFVVVEDMVSQPRIEANGQTVEYGPIYKLLHAISHDKPIVATTLAGGDYHTPPNLMRLAMAEAAANGASNLAFATWPESERARMIAAVKPQAALFRRNEALLNDAPFRADVVLYFPFGRWVETDQCAATKLAAELYGANVQFEVMSEDNLELDRTSGAKPVLVIESRLVLSGTDKAAVEAFEQAGGPVIVADTTDWLAAVRKSIERPSLSLKGPTTIRGIVHDQRDRTIVHLLNLNVKRISSFADEVHPASDVEVAVAVPFKKVRSVTLQTADAGASTESLKFEVEGDDEVTVRFRIPVLQVSAIVTVEP